MLTRPNRPRLSLLLLALLTPFSALADTAPQGDGGLQYVGETGRVSVAYARGGHFQAELLGVLHESGTSSWLGEGWLSGSAGGVQLSYHRAIDDEVRKYFIAVDQNRQHDRKLSIGMGLEQEDWFGNAYLSHSLSGRRALGQSSASTMRQQGGSEDGRPYLDTVTTTITTRLFERAYDYGLGLRVGHFFADDGIRITSGFDYEWGQGDARQANLSVAAEKFFIGTPHSVALQLDHSRKTGELETQRSDNRFLLSYRYSFGGASSRPAQQFRMVADPQTVPAPTVIPAHTERKLVKTTASINSDTFFPLGSVSLTEAARTELDRIANLLKTSQREGNVHIVGHTCDLGRDEVNDKLSVKRAEAVRDYLVAAGAFPSDAVLVEGKGKREPKYPAVAASREKNRRVDLEFVSAVSREEEIQIAAQTVPAVEGATSYHREAIEQEPAWLRLSLRTPAVHKREVDVYRSQQQSQTESRSRAWLNRAPLAQADSYSVPAGSSMALAVLSNDSDPDQDDALKLVSVGPASQGQVRLDGNQVFYTAPATFQGEDHFSYTIEDSHGATVSAEVRIKVTALSANAAPIAADDRITVSGVFMRMLSVLGNDRDPDGDALNIVSFTQPSNGTISQEGNLLRFTPAHTFLQDTFSYTISDGKGGQSTATVTLIDP